MGSQLLVHGRFTSTATRTARPGRDAAIRVADALEDRAGCRRAPCGCPATQAVPSYTSSATKRSWSLPGQAGHAQQPLLEDVVGRAGRLRGELAERGQRVVHLADVLPGPDAAAEDGAVLLGHLGQPDGGEQDGADGEHRSGDGAQARPRRACSTVRSRAARAATQRSTPAREHDTAHEQRLGVLGPQDDAGDHRRHEGHAGQQRTRGAQRQPGRRATQEVPHHVRDRQHAVPRRRRAGWW